MHPDDYTDINAAFQRVIAGEEDLDTEFRTLRPGGEIRHIRVRAETVVRSDGAETLVVGTNWDVTAEKGMQQSLAHEKERLRVTLTSIADGVVATDEIGRVTFMNPVAESLTGWREAEAEGLPVGDILMLSDDNATMPIPNPISVALSGGDVCFLREGSMLQSRDGSRYEIQDSAAPLKSADGQV